MRAYGWNLHDIDETDIGNLFAFVNFNPDKQQTDSDTRIIDGAVSRRVKDGVPSWL